jgi:dTDP-glucose pyrophosphorylase
MKKILKSIFKRIVITVKKTPWWKEIGKEASRTAAKKGVERVLAKNDKSIKSKLRELNKLEEQGIISKEEAKTVRKNIIDNAHR